MFEQAQVYYEKAMKRARDQHNVATAPPSMILEYKLWEDHWCRCVCVLGVYVCVWCVCVCVYACMCVRCVYVWYVYVCVVCVYVCVVCVCEVPVSVISLPPSPLLHNRCCQELGQWDVLTEFGKMQNGGAPFLGELDETGDQVSSYMWPCLYGFLRIIFLWAWHLGVVSRGLHNTSMLS